MFWQAPQEAEGFPRRHQAHHLRDSSPTAPTFSTTVYKSSIANKKYFSLHIRVIFIISISPLGGDSSTQISFCFANIRVNCNRMIQFKINFKRALCAQKKKKKLTSLTALISVAKTYLLQPHPFTLFFSIKTLTDALKTASWIIYANQPFTLFLPESHSCCTLCSLAVANASKIS